jgi:hypothetical protein
MKTLYILLVVMAMFLAGHSQTAEKLYSDSGNVKIDNQDYIGAIIDFTRVIEINLDA